jgi:hypothetical protein
MLPSLRRSRWHGAGHLEGARAALQPLLLHEAEARGSTLTMDTAALFAREHLDTAAR